MDKKRIVIFLAVLLALMMLHLSGVRDIITLAQIQQSAVWLNQAVQDHYFISVLSFILAFVGVAVTLIPVTILLNLLGGYLFGPILGTMYILIASVVSASVLFYGARYFFRGWLIQRFSSQLARFNRELRHRGLWYLIFLNLLPFTPTPILYLIGGISDVPFTIFLGANLVGLFPGTFLYAWLGYRLPDIQSVSELFAYDLLLLVTLAILFLVMLPYWITRRKKREHLA